MSPIRFATVCSGVDGVALAWEPLGFVNVFNSDILPFPNAVLAHHWPEVPNLGDLEKIDGAGWKGRVDVLWGSFPCQDFSEAGARRGATGTRGRLTLSGVDLVDAIDPPVFCFENVPGLLTDDKNAFGQFLGRLAGEDGPLLPAGKRWTNAGLVLGPRRAIAWRTLDAQHFGLGQQRRRVFVVACPVDGLDPGRILLEFEGVRRDAPPSRRAGDQALAALAGSAPGRARARPFLVDEDEAYSASLRTRGDMPVWELGTPGLAHCLRASQGGGDKVYVLAKHGHFWRLRKLLPVECERLMGIPDNHTLVPLSTGSMASDSARYHAIGNSVAVPVVRFIGEALQREWYRARGDAQP